MACQQGAIRLRPFQARQQALSQQRAFAVGDIARRAIHVKRLDLIERILRIPPDGDERLKIIDDRGPTFFQISHGFAHFECGVSVARP
jgi:hypothetical protein